jgi:hypothetical protein
MTRSQILGIVLEMLRGKELRRLTSGVPWLAGDRKAGPLPRLLYTSDYIRLATIRFTRNNLVYKVSRKYRSTSLQLKVFS